MIQILKKHGNGSLKIVINEIGGDDYHKKAYRQIYRPYKSDVQFLKHGVDDYHT